jgi:hypothetical protein
MFPKSIFLVFPVAALPLDDVNSLDTKHNQVPDKQSQLERKRTPFPQELYENRSILEPGIDWPETGYVCDEYEVPSVEGENVRVSSRVGSRGRVYQNRGNVIKKADLVAFDCTDPKAPFMWEKSSTSANIVYL